MGDNLAIYNPGSWRPLGARRYLLPRIYCYYCPIDHDDICERIRAKNGFKNFLELPTKYGMNAAAGQGTIVVVNLSSARSDAFLIKIRSIRLENLIEDKAKKMTGRMSKHKAPELLKWLWETVASHGGAAARYRYPLSRVQGHRSRQSHVVIRYLGKVDHVWPPTPEM